MPEPLFGRRRLVDRRRAFVVGIVGAFVFRRWAKVQQEATGRQYPVGLVALGLIVGLPVLAFCSLSGANPITFDMPEQKGLQPARRHADPARNSSRCSLGLVTYTAAFIAEIVRAGILAVSGPDARRLVPSGLRPARRCASSSSRRRCG